MDKQVIAGRLAAIRRRMRRRKIKMLVVTNRANVTYATGFMGDDSWAAITLRRAYLLTDSRYTEQAAKECPDCLIVERTGSMAGAVADLVVRIKSVQRVCVEKSVSLGVFEALQKHLKARIRSVAGIIEDLRSCKDKTEIAAIRASAAITANVLRRVLPRIKPGITETELAGLLDFEAAKAAAAVSFDTIVAFGPNASRPHHQPTTRKLKRNDTVLIDFGAKYKGYCSDITRCFAVGAATALYRRVYEVVEQAQAAAIKAIRPGVKLAAVDSTAREVIRSADLPVYGHGTGHGFGLEIHEQPFIKADTKEKLKAGQVITVEPGVYIPGKLGIRIEDDILVTPTGGVVLTRRCPHGPALKP